MNWIGLAQQDPMAGFWDHSKESSGFVKAGNLLTAE
jgi:hypothetical protein